MRAAVILLRHFHFFSACAFKLTSCRAGNKASDSGKVTLSLDHVLDALKDAGFEDMVGAVSLQVNGKNFVHIIITSIAHLQDQFTLNY